jgi:hypothetical protein
MICGKPRICLASPVREARDHHLHKILELGLLDIMPEALR